MVIAITGSGGFIGKQLTAYFENKSDTVKRLPRITSETNCAELATLLSDADVLINLAGAPIIGRWSKSYKKLLFDSRIIGTRKLVEAIAVLETKPSLFISASAVGIYEQQGVQTESRFKLSGDYLGYICSNWELEAKKANLHTRVAIARFGIVLGKRGGAMQRMLPLFKLGLGGKIASGRQGFSWIHISDVLRAVQFIIDNPKLTGEFNFTAPEVVDNARFTQILARILKRPAFFSVPSIALKLLFGEGSIAVTGGQFATPKRLLEEGFRFSYPDLEGALRDTTGN